MEAPETPLEALVTTYRLLEFVVNVAKGRVADDARGEARLVLGLIGYWLDLEDAG